MSRAFARSIVGLVVFLTAAAVGFQLTQRIAGEPLRAQAEARLSAAMGSPVSIGRVQLRPGYGLHLVGHDVVAWRNEDRVPSLQVDRLRADIRLLSLFTGRPEFSRIELEGARLRIERSADGQWTPAALAPSGAAPTTTGPSAPGTEQILSPLLRVETAMRTLLERVRLADNVELRSGTVVLIDARAERELAPPLFLALESVRGSLRHNRLTRASRLSLNGKLIDVSGARGRIEWSGARDRTGDIRVAMAVTDLQTSALSPYVRSLHPEARIEASVSGALVFETTSPGSGQLEIDLVGHRIRSVGPGMTGTPIEVDRVAAVGTLEITPQRVSLQGGRIRGGELELVADATVDRPLRNESRAQIALGFTEVEVAEVRHLIGWLPDVEREEAETIVRPLEKGRLHTLRAGGLATLAHWQDFLAGRERTPPEEFFVDATLSDTVVVASDNDRIEDLAGRLWWSGDHAEVIDARATLNGSPLPALDLSLDGVSNLLASDPTRRRLQSGGVPLPGLQPLWEWFQPDPSRNRPEIRTSFGFTIDRLHHPLVLWPIENASIVLHDTSDGLHFVVSSAVWAGIPVSGEADWTLKPEQRIRVAVEADPPRTTAAPVPPESSDWAVGRVVFGMLQDGPWGQQHATAKFRARGGTFYFDQVESRLHPSGEIEATIALDVGSPNSVPFEFDFAATGARVEALTRQLDQPEELGEGEIDLAGSLRGSLDPNRPFLDDFSGLIDVAARNGTVHRSIPAVLAVALASKSFNPFAKREEVRYERCDTVLEFADGRMSTGGFEFDGSDLRAFASGKVDLARPPHEMDVQVALFLFRQLDKVLDKIPIVNFLLLGTNNNLVGAHFMMSGPWDDPQVRTVPLKALASGPASILEQGPTSIVLQSLPMFMMKGLQAIGSVFERDDDHEAADPPADSPAEPGPS